MSDIRNQMNLTPQGGTGSLKQQNRTKIKIQTAVKTSDLLSMSVALVE